MPDWLTHLNPEERARLDQIDRERDALTSERQKLHNRAKLRRHREKWAANFDAALIDATPGPFDKPDR